MKQFVILIVISVIILPFSGNAQKKEIITKTSINKIEVIDFHSTNRCFTCNAIEANTKYTLDTYFASELESGKITFQIINVDDEVNQDIAENFEASGTSLFLNVIINNNETKINLTNFAFMKGRKQKEYSEELKAKIDSELRKL